MELLAIIVRKSEEIKGVDIHGVSAKISQYADDSTFFIKDPNSLLLLLDLLENFSRLSGLRINHHKSYLLLLGNYLHPPTSIRGIQVAHKVKILGITYKAHMSEEEQYDLIFSSKIDKIANICSSWTNRNMSLKGKITLVNSLMVSILQYPCSCTFVPVRVQNDFKRIVTNFIWDSKRPKIAYNLLIQNTELGGLKLADIETRILTSQITMIKGIWNSPGSLWASTLAAALGTNDIRITLLTRSDLSKQIPTEYSTLKQCLSAWFKHRRLAPTSESEVLEEILWGNSSIMISSKPVFWREWIAADILSINDLMHEHEPRFLSHNELAAQYNVRCTFLDLYQLRAAIPCPWKRLLLNPRKADQICKPKIMRLENSSLDISEASSKRIYSFLLLSKLPSIASQKKWPEIFQDLPQGDNSAPFWKEIYISPYCATRDTKLQTFQFKLIHRVLPCNKYLCNIRIKESDTCTYCEDVDTLHHFFWLCPPTNDFWHKIESWLALNTNIHIQLTMKLVILGFPKEDPQARVLNFILIFAKHFIYRQKLFYAGRLEILQFLREFRLKLGIEKFICTKENRPRKFARWHRIYDALG